MGWKVHKCRLPSLYSLSDPFLTSNIFSKNLFLNYAWLRLHKVQKLPEGLELTCVYSIFLLHSCTIHPLWSLDIFAAAHRVPSSHVFSSVLFFFSFNLISSFLPTHHPTLVLCPCAVMWLTARLPFSLIFLFLFFSLQFYFTVHQPFLLFALTFSVYSFVTNLFISGS